MSLDAFLGAIRDRPDDDMPRLALADFLEEAGDDARAEFVRIQCELAGPVADVRRAMLEDREHDLLDRHERDWRGFPTTNATEWQFRRGFVDQVRLPLDGFADAELVAALNAGVATRLAVDPPRDVAGLVAIPVEHESTVFDSSRVAELDLTAFQEPWDALTPYLSPDALPRLKSLAMPGGQQAEPWGDFARLGLAPQITALDIGGVVGSLAVAERALHALARSRLERLGASNTGLNAAGLQRLLASPAMAGLRDLDVSANEVAPDAWRAFALAHPELRLDRLDVSGTPLASITLEELLAARCTTTLTRLDMNRCGSARRNLEVVAESGFWTRATHFRAHSGTIPARTLEPLCAVAGPPDLELLDLADNYLRAEGVEMLCGARWARQLRWLALSRNYLDDDAVKLIAQPGVFPRLQTLHLAYNRVATEVDNLRVTDVGAAALAESPTLSRLRILTLSGCPLTAAGVEVLLNGPYWRLSGLGLSGCGLGDEAVRLLARSPRLRRLEWLDLSNNWGLRGDALRELAASPYLSELCELDIGGVDTGRAARAELAARLGPRLSV